MSNTLFNWLFNLINVFAEFGTWLTKPLPYINLSPLMMFGFGGLTAIIVASLLRLFIGG